MSCILGCMQAIFDNVGHREMWILEHVSRIHPIKRLPSHLDINQISPGGDHRELLA